jgi:hypothetical protein
VLLHVTELLEPAVAVAALVGLLAGVYPDVLDKLVIAREGFEALLALVGLDLVPGYHAAGPDTDAEAAAEACEAASDSTGTWTTGAEGTRGTQFARMHLHGVLVHEDLREELPGLVGMLRSCPSMGRWRKPALKPLIFLSPFL